MALLQPLTLFDDLTPHGYCLLWEPGLIWTHLLADLLIAGAYLSIPAALVIVGQRRPDLNYAGVLYLFAAFIIMCAVTHLFGVLTIWYPLYSLQAGAKAMAAVVSVGTAVVVWRLLDAVLSLPTHSALRDAYRRLEEANHELETRVDQRTRELSDANSQLRHAVAEAELAVRAKEQFLARMSHELRTPLNAVIGFNELMTMELAGPLTAAQRGYLENMKDASVQLLDQINDILDLERVRHTGADLKPTDVNLQQAIQEVFRILAPLSENRRTELALVQDGDAEIRSDGRAIRTIIMNLVSNAIKYSPGGGRVDVITRLHPSGVAFEVRDQGVGIPEHQQAHVFDPFFRGHEHDLPGVGGTGLGLALVKQMVDALGGQIQLVSSPGAGTVVSVIIPSLPAPSDTLPAAS
jgi:signal transduction histidine kinase